jgi:uncharacterized membrane protein YGL010W
MKPLADQMSVYAAYHRHPVNRGIHFIGIPAIVWSIMVFLGFLTIAQVSNLEVTAAHVAVILLLGWYLALDFPLGVASVVVFTALLVSALQLIAYDATVALAAGGAVFVLGWVVQFIGHGVWEKRRPALMDNLFQVFVAPIFLVAETAFALGLRKGLHDEVRQKMQAHLPAAKQAAKAAA